MALDRSSGRWRRLARDVGMIGLISIALTSTPQTAWGIKWAKGCPAMRPRLISAGDSLSTSAPFVHPGHERRGPIGRPPVPPGAVHLLGGDELGQAEHHPGFTVRPDEQVVRF